MKGREFSKREIQGTSVIGDVPKLRHTLDLDCVGYGLC